MNVLITGGAGFIGSHLVDYHIKKGDKVFVVDNLSAGVLDNLAAVMEHKNFEFHQADILTWDGLKDLVVQVNRIYHLAAVVGMFTVLREPERTLAINIAGTERLLRTILAVKTKPQVILASSSEVYGTPVCHGGYLESDKLIMESAAKLRWNYAISKLADEAFGITYHREHNIPVLIIRFFNTTGPRQLGTYGMVLPRFINQAVHNLPLTVYGDGKQTRSFANIADTVRLLNLLADEPKSYGQIFNLGSDREISILDLAKLVIQLANSKSEIQQVSYLEAYGKEYEDITCRRPDLTKLRKFIPVNFNFTLEDTIQEIFTIERNHEKY